MAASRPTIGELRTQGKPLKGNLTIKAWRGKDLVEKNKISGKSDPYLVFSIVHGADKKEIHKTEVEKHTVDPDWQNSRPTSIYSVENDLAPGTKLLIECFDYEKIGHHHHMGHVEFDLDSIHAEFDVWSGKEESIFSSEEENATSKVYPLQQKSGDPKGYVSLTLQQLWEEEAPLREAAHKKAEDDAKRKQEEEEEAARQKIKAIQARSIADEETREKQGANKVQHFAVNNRKEQVENLRHTDYDAYTNLCYTLGRTPLPRP